MKSRWLRARAWAGLTEMSGADPVLVPVPWGMAARVWVLVYLGSTLGMAGIAFVSEILMGGGVYWGSQVMAPAFGAVMFIHALGGVRRPVRSTRAVDRRRVRTGRWAAISAWVAAFAMAGVANGLVQHVGGWGRFGVAVSMATVTCAVFVAVTHVPSRLASSD